LAKQQLGVVPQEFNFGQFEKAFDILVTQADLNCSFGFFREGTDNTNGC
jgi:hypothetical protein